MKMMNSLILALDVEPKDVKKLVRQLKSHIEIFKIGSRLFTEVGPKVVDWVHAEGCKVFLDLKFHDIPQTVKESARHAVQMGVWGFTIHTSGGFAMMSETAKVVSEESKKIKIKKPLVFGVTVLTSLSTSDLKEVGVKNTAPQQVVQLAKLAQKANLDGIVCSGNELSLVRKNCGNKFLTVVPGIRPSQNLDTHGDQKRVMTPKKALDEGANYLVVGRPIVDAKDRILAAHEILKEIRK